MAEEQGGGQEALNVFSSHREEPSGQSADTPPAVDEPKGQKPDDTPTGKQEGASEEETPTSNKEGSPKPEKEEKPPPYDQDPKWKAARKAEARLDKLAEKHGYEDHDALIEAFEEGQDVRDVLGKRDIVTLIRDSRRLTDFEAEHGALDQVIEVLANQSDDFYEDDPEVRKIKEENLELKRRQEQDEHNRQVQERKATALKNYTEDVTGIIDGIEFPKEQKELATLLHGVQNPAMEVDITDRVAVKRMARSLTKRVEKIIGTIKQNAIDEYAAGKSGLVPKASDKKTPQEKDIEFEVPTKKGKTMKKSDVDEVFDQMGARFIEEAERAMSG